MSWDFLQSMYYENLLKDWGLKCAKNNYIEKETMLGAGPFFFHLKEWRPGGVQEEVRGRAGEVEGGAGEGRQGRCQDQGGG